VDPQEALVRARAYRSAGRPREALNEIRRALASDPEDPYLLLYAAICASDLDEYVDALGYAQSLIGVAPDWAAGHHQLGVIYLQLKRPKEAEASIRQSIELDPESDDAWAALAIVLIQRRKQKESLEAAETALSIDADNSTALNARAQALGLLGRTGEAMDAAKMAARQLPDDTDTHQVLGWAALRAGRVDEAMASFTEALRLDPTDGDAREGLLEALRGRFWPYRLLLGYYFWISRFGTQMRWTIIIAITLLPRALRWLSTQNPAWRPVLIPVAAVVVLFIWSQWFLAPLINVSLMFHRLGRYALTRGQTANALCILVLLASTFVLVMTVLATGKPLDGAGAVAGMGVLTLFCLGGIGSYSKSERLLKWGSVAVLVAFGLIQIVVFVGAMKGIS